MTGETGIDLPALAGEEVSVFKKNATQVAFSPLRVSEFRKSCVYSQIKT